MDWVNMCVFICPGNRETDAAVVMEERVEVVLVEPRPNFSPGGLVMIVNFSLATDEAGSAHT
jgi:hypothetical protein